jgi:hypothetical protein
MSVLDKLLPREASNDYQGSPIALYGFWLLMAPFTFRSLVHFLKDDGGVNSIATIVLFSGTPDPNQAVYMFSSLWGSQQLVMVLLYLVVLLRYRNLLPLMYALVLAESLFRMVVGAIHPLTEGYFRSTPPGRPGGIAIMVLAAVMLILSLRTRPAKALEPEPA